MQLRMNSCAYNVQNMYIYIYIYILNKKNNKKTETKEVLLLLLFCMYDKFNELNAKKTKIDIAKQDGQFFPFL